VIQKNFAVELPKLLKALLAQNEKKTLVGVRLELAIQFLEAESAKGRKRLWDQPVLVQDFPWLPGHRGMDEDKQTAVIPSAQLASVVSTTSLEGSLLRTRGVGHRWLTMQRNDGPNDEVEGGAKARISSITLEMPNVCFLAVISGGFAPHCILPHAKMGYSDAVRTCRPMMLFACPRRYHLCACRDLAS